MDIWTVLEGVGGCLGYLVIVGVNASSVMRFWLSTSEEEWYVRALECVRLSGRAHGRACCVWCVCCVGLRFIGFSGLDSSTVV